MVRRKSFAESAEEVTQAWLALIEALGIVKFAEWLAEKLNGGGRKLNENISQVIEKIAEKFGATGAHLFGVMTRQALISGIVWTVVQVILVVVIPVVIVKLARLTAHKQEDICREDNELIVIFLWLFGGIVFTVIFLVCVFSLPDSIMSIINPEYYAIKDVLEALK